MEGEREGLKVSTLVLGLLTTIVGGVVVLCVEYAFFARPATPVGRAESKPIVFEPKDMARVLSWNDAIQTKDDIQSYIPELDRLLARRPGDANRHLERGCFYLKLNKYPDAMHDFDAAIRLDPDKASPYRLRAYANVLAGDNTAAIADYTRAIRLDPSDAESLLNRDKLKNGP